MTVSSWRDDSSRKSGSLYGVGVGGRIATRMAANFGESRPGPGRDPPSFSQETFENPSATLDQLTVFHQASR
jgi:hypothetical protein